MLRRAAAVATEVDGSTPRVSIDPGSLPGRLERMFRAHHAVVWRMLRCRGLAPDAAGDATQEVFLIAAQRLADIDLGSERAFLIGTALRLAHTARRTNARWQLEPELDLPDLRHGNAAEQGSALELIGMVLSRIDPSLVEVFMLFELAGFSSVEIARLLGIPTGTATSRLRRAREAFREAARRIELTIRREEKRP
jgi:RNA polymerase sigma-70 factor (ECF subfamily)